MLKWNDNKKQKTFIHRVAARLMVNYPGKVTCDSDTYFNSKQPNYLFQREEEKILKGFQNLRPIYEYLGMVKIL